MRKLSNLKKDVSYLRELERTVTTIHELVNLIDGEDSDMRTEISSEIEEILQNIEDWELRGALEGPFVKNNVIMAIHAGAGGTESQDWVSILLRMSHLQMSFYLLWGILKLIILYFDIVSG